MSFVLLSGNLGLHHHLNELLKAIEPGIGIVDPLVELGSRFLKPFAVLFQQLAKFITGLDLLIGLGLEFLEEASVVLEYLLEIALDILEPRLVAVCNLSENSYLFLDEKHLPDPLGGSDKNVPGSAQAAFRAFRRLLILYRRHLSPFALAALVATRASSNSSIPACAS